MKNITSYLRITNKYEYTNLWVLLFFLTIINFQSLYAQNNFKSITEEESQRYRKYHFTNEAQWDSLQSLSNSAPIKKNEIQNTKLNSCQLNKRVFGYHPYWMGTSYINYKWNLLTDLCYFDYTIQPSTGNNVNTSFKWLTSTAVTNAISNGVNASFCVTLFSGHTTFLASNSAKQTLISNIISLLKTRNGKGVNVDFEGLAASNKTAFTTFVTDLCTKVHDSIPGSEVSIALYSVDWNNVFDVTALNQSVDMFILMGYDYYWSGSPTAGPNDPLYDFDLSSNYTLSKSITYYLKKGVTASKLLLGLPYYGREWETYSDTLYSGTTGNYNSTKLFNVVKNNINGFYSTKKWNYPSSSPYYTYSDAGKWRQCFINDSASFSKRCEVANMRGLGGIGIWALGYDDGYNDYWNVIQNKMSSCAINSCEDTLYDMGGPARNYYDSEQYFYSINAISGQSVILDFKSFDVEANYDTLWLYNGDTTTAPLIGNYTGTNSPGIITSSGQSLCLRFKSDGATNKTGWKAFWQCVPSTATSVNENDIGSMNVFPNPTSDKIKIDVGVGKKVESVKMIDVLGRENVFTLGGSQVLDVSSLCNGVYILQIFTDGNRVFSKKIIISKIE